MSAMSGRIESLRRDRKTAVSVRIGTRTGRGFRAAIAVSCLLAGTIPAAVAKNAPVPVSNPLATQDQTEAHRQALRLLQRPEVREARANVEMRWRRILHNEPPVEAWLAFDDMLADYTYNYALKAVANPNYPRVIHIYTQPHKWRGMAVPGSRWGGNNPDNIYRIIPVDGAARFRIDGRRTGTGPSNVSYQLVADYPTTGTLGLLTDRDLTYNPDGTFSIELGPEPANGRKNYIQTRPGALFVFIRDTLNDWDQKADALSVTRLDAPAAPPRSDEQAAGIAAQAMISGMAQVYYYTKVAHGIPNYFPPFPKSSGPTGGLYSQRATYGDAMLGDDDALIVTLQPGGARYYSLVAHDWWFITRDVTKYQSSLTNAQSVPNADGTVTFVLSIKDPGVWNWVDTGGLHNPIMMIRLQGLASDPAVEPWVRTRLVKLSDLEAELPPDTRRATPAERAAQIAKRKRQYDARLADK